MSKYEILRKILRDISTFEKATYVMKITMTDNTLTGVIFKDGEPLDSAYVNATHTNSNPDREFQLESVSEAMLYNLVLTGLRSTKALEILPDFTPAGDES